jgi:hypothetical protein
MSPPGDPDHVDGWLATAFHRSLIAAPAAGIVGAGLEDGSWAVMNATGQKQNILVRPYGYPNGRWRGPEGFSGEIPDPVAECQEGGQPIEYPVGIAVTLFVPADIPRNDAKVTSIEVREDGSSNPLRGCLLEDADPYGGATGVFVLDDPLVVGTTYHASGRWYTGSDRGPTAATIPGTTLGYEWSFTFQPDRPTGHPDAEQAKRCRIAIVRRAKRYRSRPPRAKRKRRKAVGARLHFSQSAQIRIQRARIVYRVRGKREVANLVRKRLRRRTFKVGRRTVLWLRLPGSLARRIPVGKRVNFRFVLIVRSGKRECFRRLRAKRSVRTPVLWIHKKTSVVSRRRASRKQAKKRGDTSSILRSSGG